MMPSNLVQLQNSEQQVGRFLWERVTRKSLFMGQGFIERCPWHLSKNIFEK
jgi:hypothetical protein